MDHPPLRGLHNEPGPAAGARAARAVATIGLWAMFGGVVAMASTMGLFLAGVLGMKWGVTLAMHAGTGAMALMVAGGTVLALSGLLDAWAGAREKRTTLRSAP